MALFGALSDTGVLRPSTSSPLCGGTAPPLLLAWGSSSSRSLQAREWPCGSWSHMPPNIEPNGQNCPPSRGSLLVARRGLGEHVAGGRLCPLPEPALGSPVLHPRNQRGGDSPKPALPEGPPAPPRCAGGLRGLRGHWPCWGRWLSRGSHSWEWGAALEDRTAALGPPAPRAPKQILAASLNGAEDSVPAYRRGLQALRQANPCRSGPQNALAHSQTGRPAPAQGQAPLLPLCK